MYEVSLSGTTACALLNVTLSEEVSTTTVTQRNLELLLPPDSLDSHQIQKQ